MISLVIWLIVQIAIVGMIGAIAWFVLAPVPEGIDARLMSLESEPVEGWGGIERIYLWKAAVGWALPFFIVVVLMGILLWSIGFTVREIAEWRERLGMRR